MQLVELTINEEEGQGVFAISLVDRPAIETDFVFLASEKPYKFEITDEEQRIVAGPILIPNKPIYREHPDGEPYNVFFSKGTVEKAAKLYLEEKRQDSTTIQHFAPIKGATLVQSWIVKDSKLDTYKAYQPEETFPPGTWFGVMSIDNDEIWEMVKDGTFKGFSIEMIGTENEFKKQKITEMDKFSKIVSELKKIVFEEAETEHQLASVELEDGTSLVSDDEEFIIGNPIFVEKDGERSPAEPGEYVGNNESIYVVTDENLLGEIRDPEAIPEEDIAAEALKSTVNENKETVGEILNILTGMHEKMESVKKGHETELASLKTELEASKVLLAELGAPADKAPGKKPQGNKKVQNVTLESLKGKSVKDRAQALKEMYSK